MRLLRGRQYNRLKKAEHDGGKGQIRSGGQNDHHSEKTEEKLAKEHGVSPKTIRRDAKAVEILESHPGLL